MDLEHCIAVASGTDALLIALKALGVDAGDEVIWFQQPAKIKAAISPRTKAIIPVSLYEQSADFPAINAIAERHGLSVIEDGAQSLGGRQHGQLSCSLGKIGTASFSHPKRSTAMALVALVEE